VNQEILLFDLGFIPYEKGYHLQKQLAEKVAEKSFSEALLLVEHPPVYTVGKSGSEKSVLENVPVVLVDRGGDITYHGPGQLVGYPILWLRDGKVSHYIRTLEKSLILLLSKYCIQGFVREGYPGVWVGNEKIASIGVRIRKGVTYHGFALNVSVDLQAFQAIKPCGLDITMTSMEVLLKKDICMEEVKCTYKKAFEKWFHVRLVQGDTSLLYR
jgi:lipoate-protein ligase B